MSQIISTCDEYVLNNTIAPITIDPKIVTEQFRSIDLLKKFMDEALIDILYNKKLQKELQD